MPGAGRLSAILLGLAAVIGGLCGVLAGHPYVGSAVLLLGGFVFLAAVQSEQKSR